MLMVVNGPFSSRQSAAAVALQSLLEKKSRDATATRGKSLSLHGGSFLSAIGRFIYPDRSVRVRFWESPLLGGCKCIVSYGNAGELKNVLWESFRHREMSASGGFTVNVRYKKKSMTVLFGRPSLLTITLMVGPSHSVTLFVYDPLQ